MLLLSKVSKNHLQGQLIRDCRATVSALSKSTIPVPEHFTTQRETDDWTLDAAETIYGFTRFLESNDNPIFHSHTNSASLVRASLFVSATGWKLCSVFGASFPPLISDRIASQVGLKTSKDIATETGLPALICTSISMELLRQQIEAELEDTSENAPLT